MTKKTFWSRIWASLSMDMFWMESRLNSNKIILVLIILLSSRCIRKYLSMLRKIPKFKKNFLKTIEFPTETHSISTHFNSKSSWNFLIMTYNSKMIKFKIIIKKLLSLFSLNLIVKILTDSFWILWHNYKTITKSNLNFKT